MLPLSELASEKNALDAELDPTHRRALARIWDGLLAKWHQDQRAQGDRIERLEAEIEGLRAVLKAATDMAEDYALDAGVENPQLMLVIMDARRALLAK